MHIPPQLVCAKVQSLSKSRLLDPKPDKHLNMRHDNEAKERRHLQRQKNGCLPDAHEEDEILNKNKKFPETKEKHKEVLNLWL